MAMAIRATQSCSDRSLARFKILGPTRSSTTPLSPPVDVSAFSSFFVGDLTPMNNGPRAITPGVSTRLNSRSGVAWIARP